MANIPPYTIQVVWSGEDGEFVATCLEIPGLSGLAPTEEEAVRELKVAIKVWLDHLLKNQLPVPEPHTRGIVMTAGGDFQASDPRPGRAETEAPKEHGEVQHWVPMSFPLVDARN